MPSWKIVVGVLALGFVSFCTLIGIAYAMTPVPAEPTVEGVKDQASIFYYDDGKTEIGRIGKKREIIKLNQVPEHVQEAVLAAENRSFRTDPGFSPKGIARAVWVNARGGKQGGSTITQQLAKNYYSDIQNRTMKRKFQELFISVKLENKWSKDRILEQYLNTIYFGRDTYGIQAAAREYFDKDVGKLNEGEAALLAGIIQNPNREVTDKENQPWGLSRMQYVLDGLVKMGAIDQATHDKYYGKLPIIEKSGGDLYGGVRGYMLSRAKLELERKGISNDVVTSAGLRIVTTFNEAKMKAAKKAAEKAEPELNPKKLPKGVRVGLVSVNSANGEVVAFYGGHDFLDQQFDSVWQGSAQAGSAMKPYVMATALKKGFSLKSLLEGKSGSCFDGAGNVIGKTASAYCVPNSHSKDVVNLIEATRDSINTAYVQLGLKVGLKDVIQTAEDAGIASTLLEGREREAGLSLGINDIRPVEQAAGYQTFANGGTYHQPHVIKKVYKSDNKTVYKTLTWEKRKVFSEQVAADATYALQSVVTGGTGTAARLPDRPAAGKTGTTDRNVATWFVGYVPQMSTAVTVYNEKTEKVGGVARKKSLRLPGYGEVTGGRLPAKLWHAYMIEATKGMPVEQFPPPAYGGGAMKWATPKPTPTVTQTPDCLPGQRSRPRKPCREQDPPPGPVGGGEPCQDQSGMNPPGCNRNLPPNGLGQPQPDWWCAIHPEVGPPMCRPRGPINPTPSGENPGDDGEQQSGGFYSRPPDG